MQINNSSLSIVLVEPQMGENIGACARVMKNFGISDLRLVNPRDGWPNTKAEAIAVGAVDIVQSAKIYNTLEDAVGNLEYLYATTVKMRDLHKECISVRDARDDYPSHLKVGILFGRESSGLSNAEIALANKILTIPTQFTSMNLSHAVAIICYELISVASLERNLENVATKSEIHYFCSRLFCLLERYEFFRVEEKRSLMKLHITNILSKMHDVSKNEIQILHGILSAFTDKS